MLIAEDLALLLAEGDAGTSATTTPRGEYSLAGALLIELAMLDRVDVTDGTHPANATAETAAPGETGDAGASGPLATGRLVVHDPGPTGHPALDSALAVLSTLEGAKPKDAVGALANGTMSTDLRTWPGGDPAAEGDTADVDRLRAGLREVLVDGREPDERTTALIALLTGTAAVGSALGPDGNGNGNGDAERAVGRAARIAEGNGAGDPLCGSVEEITATVLAGLLVPTLVTGSGPGGDSGGGADAGDPGGNGGVPGGGSGADHGLS